MLAGPSIVLKLLGRPQILVDGAPIGALPKKAFVLSAMLILTAENMRATRDEISAFLWPDAKPGPRGASLRTLIRRMRAATEGLPKRPLRIGDKAVAMVSEACWCDLIELCACLSQGDPQAMGVAAALMDEALLEGFEADGISSRAWILARRETLALEFARKASLALKSPALLGNPRLREALELKILELRPIDVEAQTALAKLIGGALRAKPARRDPPPSPGAGRVELPLSRGD